MARPSANGSANGSASGEKLTANAEPTSKKSMAGNKTDYRRWRMLDIKGRQTWHYLVDDEDVAEWPQTTADKYYLGLPTVRALQFEYSYAFFY